MNANPGLDRREPRGPRRAAAARRGEGAAAATVSAPLATRRASVPLLREMPLLRTLAVGHLALLAEHAQVLSMRRGAILAAQGLHRDALLVLLSGRAHALRCADDGRLVLLDVLHTYDTVGALGVVDGEPETATVRAVTPVEMLCVPDAAVLHCMRQSPELADAFAALLIRRLRRVNRRIASLALHHVRDRLVWHLAEMGERQPDGRYRVPDRVNRTELALMVGASREMVSRAMGALEHDGVVTPGDDGTLHVTVSPELEPTLAGER